ncbi:MAG: acyl-ACP--UDP-N-acetylglucosamine O-acyltransferase, partial [bacterium]
MRSGSNWSGAIIHPTALVNGEVVIGEGCYIGPFCNITGKVTIGACCRFGTGVVIGTPPMDRKYQGEDTAVLIGSNNTFFEFVTVHRSTGSGGMTVIGDNNYIMSYVHIAHNCRIGNNCTLANGVQLGGHTEIGNGANLGGLVGVHQYCRIGKLAMVGAHSYVNKDIMPFVLAAGNPCRVRGLNLIGLKRAGLNGERIAVIERAFRLIYRSGLTLTAALKKVEQELIPSPAADEIKYLIEFCQCSTRGVELRT